MSRHQGSPHTPMATDIGSSVCELRWKEIILGVGSANYKRVILHRLSMGWWNWYLVFGHGCDTTDSRMSPQPRHSRGCGDIWESVVSQPWPKTRYQFLFYHGTTQLTLKYESLPSQTASQLSKFKEQSHCKHWVTWPDCFATPSNHCDGPVSLICIDTLDKKMS